MSVLPDPPRRRKRGEGTRPPARSFLFRGTGRLRTTCRRREHVTTHGRCFRVVPVPRGAEDRSRDVAGHADAVPVPQHAVKPVDRPTNRIAAGASAAGRRTVRNTPAGRTNKFRNSPESGLRAGPRAVLDSSHLPTPPRLAPAAAPGSADFDSGGTLSPVPCADRLRPHANDASDTPSADSRNCNTGFAVALAQTGKGSPSTGTAGYLAVGRHPRQPPRSLDLPRRPADSTVGPRERITPYGSSLGKKLISPSRGAFYSLPPRRNHAAAALFVRYQSTLATTAARPKPLRLRQGHPRYRPRTPWLRWLRESGTVPDRC